ncbi:phosphatidylinositol 4-kinase gamma 8 [Trifolium pratense]|uniref:phosphatidylinositol 4-kinase gamma 8 n=1 Tax=Trifolium pratense TaxID=57577 RepID=UPI001E68FF33|nr:phosphatidylinositol 4-kinase gamma 8 [Trifolium pratense]
MRLFEMAVAIDQQHHGFKPFSRSQRCKLQSFGHLDYNNILELNQTTILAFQADNIHRSFSTPCLPLTGVEDLNPPHPRIEIVRGSGAPVHALVVEVAVAMASGIQPIPLPSGLGGAYVFHNQNGNNIAVAKPVDEEPFALNNPEGLQSTNHQMLGQPSLKRPIRIGETGIRELAAYLLDHGGFSGVPPTALVKFCHATFSDSSATVKLASLQRFVGHGFDAGELGPSLFSVDSVHKIGILDIRLMNLDRHAGNMLVMKHDHNSFVNGNAAADLVPIDHGFCLPEWLDDPYFEWLHWPQASIPFSESELEYISKLDPFKDADILRSEVPSLRESSIRVLIVCTVFLKQAAVAGLCLADIGQMMTREFCRGEESSSELENICLKLKTNINNENGKEQDEKETNCGISGISFGDMNKGEWELFLENFDKFVIGVFEDNKCKN